MKNLANLHRFFMSPEITAGAIRAFWTDNCRATCKKWRGECICECKLELTDFDK